MVRARVRESLWRLWLGILLLAGTPAFAHLTPNSEIKLDVMGNTVTAHIIVPASEYAYASGNPATDSADARSRASEYLRDRFALSDSAGTPWTATVEEVRFAQVAGPPDLFATMRFAAPSGSDPRAFDLKWRVVVDKVPDHFALFLLQRDFRGSIGEDGRVLAIVRQDDDTVPIALNRPSRWTALANAIALGAQHILGGLDHLAFLMALLLTVPLVADRRKWREDRPIKSAIRSIVALVTGFTVGHSVTLTAAVLGNWKLPTAPVEIAIALSVLVAGLHAVRPIFAGREMIVALAFGLIHGLGFAGFLADIDADIARNALTLLGFNLGLELVQLAVVALVAPILIVLARHQLYRLPRVLVAVTICLAATLWIAERAADVIA